MNVSFRFFAFFAFSLYLFLISTSLTSASVVTSSSDISCEYQSQIDECLEANKGGDPRSIEDFVCLQSTDTSEIAYQIVMDLKFKEIDEKAEQEAKNIENNCETWYGENATEDEITVPDTITSIYGIHGKHWSKYQELLDPNNQEGILAITVACLGGKTLNTQATDFFSPAFARNVFEQKLDTLESTSYEALKLCKQRVRQDARKNMMQESRKKYDSVSDLFQSVLGYFEKIWKKWPSKTKDNYL